LKAWHSIRQFEGRSSFYTWLYSITVNLAIESLRRRRRCFEVELDHIPSSVPSPRANYLVRTIERADHPGERHLHIGCFWLLCLLLSILRKRPRRKVWLHLALETCQPNFLFCSISVLRRIGPQCGKVRSARFCSLRSSTRRRPRSHFLRRLQRQRTGARGRRLSERTPSGTVGRSQRHSAGVRFRPPKKIRGKAPGTQLLREIEAAEQIFVAGAGAVVWPFEASPCVSCMREKKCMWSETLPHRRSPRMTYSSLARGQEVPRPCSATLKSERTSERDCCF
jgi:Sigma-70 region 2